MTEAIIRSNNVDVMIASSYRRAAHHAQVQQASESLSEIGLNPYPPFGQKEAILDDGFVLFEGASDGNEGDLVKSKHVIERGFLDGIRAAKALYAVPTGGYLGRSGAVEVLYALGINKPVALSERVKFYGEEVSPSVKDIINKYQVNLPIIPVDEITQDAFSEVTNSVEQGVSLTPEEHLVVWGAIRALLKDLRPAPEEIKEVKEKGYIGDERMLAGFTQKEEESSILDVISRYPELFSAEEEGVIRRYAETAAVIKSKEQLGLVGTNPIPSLVKIMDHYHREKAEEHADDTRFDTAKAILVELDGLFKDAVDGVVNGEENSGNQIAREDAALLTFPFLPQVHLLEPPIPILELHENERVLLNRLLFALGARNKDFADLGLQLSNTDHGYIGVGNLATKYKGVTWSLGVDKQRPGILQFSLGFNPIAKRVISLS